MVSFTRVFTFIALILGVHALAIASGWYEYNKWFDIPMHFAGGCAMALLALAAWRVTIQKITFHKIIGPGRQQLFYALGVLGFVALVGVAWEWYEFIFDNLAVMYSYDIRPAQMGLGDTMADLFLDLLGGLLMFTLFRERTQK